MRLNFTFEQAEQVIENLILTSEMNVPNFCKAVGYSRQHVDRNYSEKFGECLLDTVGRVRINLLIIFATKSNMSRFSSYRQLGMTEWTAERAMRIFHGKSFLATRSHFMSNKQN